MTIASETEVKIGDKLTKSNWHHFSVVDVISTVGDTNYLLVTEGQAESYIRQRKMSNGVPVRTFKVPKKDLYQNFSKDVPTPTTGPNLSPKPKRGLTLADMPWEYRDEDYYFYNALNTVVTRNAMVIFSER
jgi:hypothetical protein